MMSTDKEKITSKKELLIKLTNDFCLEHINNEYSKLCEKLILKMARKKSVPFLLGKTEIWAAGIIHTIGFVNFLFDGDEEPYIDFNTITAYFNTSKSTVGQKSKLIRDLFKMTRFDDDFSTKVMSENNPYNNFFMLGNGVIVTKDSLKRLADQTKI